MVCFLLSFLLLGETNASLNALISTEERKHIECNVLKRSANFARKLWRYGLFWWSHSIEKIRSAVVVKLGAGDLWLRANIEIPSLPAVRRAFHCPDWSTPAAETYVHLVC